MFDVLFDVLLGFIIGLIIILLVLIIYIYFLNLELLRVSQVKGVNLSYLKELEANIGSNVDLFIYLAGFVIILILIYIICKIFSKYI